MKNMFLITAILLSTVILAETHRELQFENDEVRVWKTVIEPGSPLKFHRHNLPRVVVGLKGGTLRKVTSEGKESNLVFETGKACWLSSDPEGELHADLNESNEVVEVMVVELKKECGFSAEESLKRWR